LITVVVLSERLDAVLPAAALPALRSAKAVYAGEGVPLEFWSTLGVDGPAPAVVNAIRHLGLDVRNIPAVPEAIREAACASR
jgi:hypothetical protein